jgi:hypothetical protein
VKATLELLILQPEEIASNVRSTMAVLGYALRQAPGYQGYISPSIYARAPTAGSLLRRRREY